MSKKRDAGVTVKRKRICAVVISNGIRALVEPRILPGVPIYWEDDLCGRLAAFSAACHGAEGAVLVFAPLRDLTAAGRMAAELPDGIICRFVGFSTAGETLDDENVSESLLTAFRSGKMTGTEFEFLVRRHLAPTRSGKKDARGSEADMATLLDTLSDQEALISIGRSLSLEKDPDKLLRSMLYLSKKITGADAGSIFLVEKQDGRKYLRFTYTHTFSREIPFEQSLMPLDTTSIAGYVAATGRVLNLPDVYRLKPDDPISFNPDFDRRSGYRTRSMLAVPMRNHLDEVIGVIQLINSKERRSGGRELSGDEAYSIRLVTERDFERYVVPFHTRYEALMEAVASQAAIALENRMMIRRIQEQFEGFVRASVSAIESRDPVTSGHSFRVAELSVRIAQAVNNCTTGALGGLCFTRHEIREIELAGVLHDFGKLYIEPAVFLKAKKLYPEQLELLLLRQDFLRRTVELSFEKRRAALASASAPASEFTRLDRELTLRLSRLDEIKAAVLGLNEPSAVPDHRIEAILADIEAERDFDRYTDYADEPIPLLTEEERRSLAIRRGSLNPEEREAIQSHVTHTYEFVRCIPWPNEFRNIPEIALFHHERLDGSGYPEGRSGQDSIPIQSRIIALADVYDALTAPDRPYKKAIPEEKVREILRDEAASGKLDPDLVELFLREQPCLTDGLRSRPADASSRRPGAGPCAAASNGTGDTFLL
jgi:HD-GYP domain-containing protein (c-di-GMP phosphodiesterase class II)